MGRNFIIQLDEKDSIDTYFINNFENLSKAIDKFFNKCFSESAETEIYYKPRKFIYTTIQIYSTLPEYFKQDYKLINAPDKENDEDIIERVRTIISEKHEKRFEDIEVDWQESVNEEMKEQSQPESNHYEKPISSSSKKDSQEKLLEMIEKSTSNAITEIVDGTERSTNKSNQKSKLPKTNSKTCYPTNCCKIL